MTEVIKPTQKVAPAESDPTPSAQLAQSGSPKEVDPDQAVKDQIELEYKIQEEVKPEENEEGTWGPGDGEIVVELKDLYKALALKLVEVLPESRERFLALDELKQSKAWAVSLVV